MTRDEREAALRPTFEERLEAVEEAVGAAIGAVVVTEADDGDLDAVALRRLAGRLDTCASHVRGVLRAYGRES
jgi:hypothetical protein